MQQQDIIFKLSSLANRFPRGLELSKQDLLFVGWLYFREMATEAARISDRELRQQLSHAAVQLGMEDDVSQPAQVIDRLVRFRMVRTSVTDSRAQEYCLTRLGRSLARDLLEDADFGSEDLCTLLNQAHSSLRQEMTQGDPAELAKWLTHFFHGTIREKIEYKLLSIEEGLLDQEQTAKRLGSGQDELAFEEALTAVRRGREYLDELLDAVQDGSAYMPLMAALSECHDRFSQPELRTAIGRALDFLEGMRHRIERMLANLIRFVRQCVSYQSFVGSLSRRDALGRLQLDLLRLALREPLSMPVVGQNRPCAISLEFSASQNQAPVTLDPAALEALSAFVPEPVRNIQAPWRGDFLDEAHRQWGSTPFSPRPLAAWIRSLLAAHAVDPDAEILALWYLLNDMSGWKPAVLVRAADAPWESLGPTLMQPVILDTPHV
ncbi:hypothetical protein SAMN05421830_11619 [Desulfomicrobium norvegicum]|jgi:hypothetical protein|uniref:Uncharacterized protein n=1 Tax=Desulfomicrobium norvegicum (strain DSM 1741 / NCIMB 8310) TaxID=52561 RepID=A0A8G2C5N4_DESNO|nr:hypothetical protein [Desulfomicrobium norvegicum]SFM14025.1 hypothetical protein SAMN05421830_11619 [Desulfomicrobium norvegicum]